MLFAYCCLPIAGYWLRVAWHFAIDCSLLIVCCCWLLVAGFLLLCACCWLFVVGCLLLSVCFWLLTSYWLLIGCCLLACCWMLAFCCLSAGCWRVVGCWPVAGYLPLVVCGLLHVVFCLPVGGCWVLFVVVVGCLLLLAIACYSLSIFVVCYLLLLAATCCCLLLFDVVSYLLFVVGFPKLLFASAHIPFARSDSNAWSNHATLFLPMLGSGGRVGGYPKRPFEPKSKTAT